MTLSELTTQLRGAIGVISKRDIQVAARHLGLLRASGEAGLSWVGDDCAVIPDGSGHLLLAAEGMWPAFVATEPYFAGYSAVMVNVCDIYAMGGRPLAVVDVVWGTSSAALEPIWEGMTAASRAYGVPIVGGHTNARSPYDALAVAILGRATHLLTSRGARLGDVLLLAADLRGRPHPKHPFWDASTGVDPARLRADLAILPELAESGLCDAAKDISMGGIVGTLLMFLEASGRGAVLDLDAVPRPPTMSLDRWLLAFPSYGFLLSVRPSQVPLVQAAFGRRELACAPIGAVDASRRLALRSGGEEQVAWDFSTEPLTGFAGEERS